MDDRRTVDDPGNEVPTVNERSTIELSDPGLVVLVGPAGCGKSRFARRHFASEEILSSDDFRALVAGDAGDQRATPAAFSLLGHALAERMKRRRFTVVDATNLTPRDRRRLLGVAAQHQVPAAAIAFDVPLAVCQQRAAERLERTVPPDIIARQHATFRRHLDGLGDEGFAEVAVLSVEDLDTVEVERAPTLSAPGPAPEGARRLPPAAIIDLDGTLASATWREHHLRGGRKDWAGFFAGMKRDAPVPGLVDLTAWIAHHAAVILLTGRPADHATVVRRWLADHAVPYDLLLMRPSGDRRPDTVMKRERYHHDVAPSYDVRIVIDDRPSVIEMWRQEGLYVLTAVDPSLDPLPGS